MTRLVFVVMFASGILRAQESNSVRYLMTLSDRLSIAVETGDWKEAAALSKALAVLATRARNSSLRRSTTEQVNQVLGWLPEDTETLLVASEPFLLSERGPDTMLKGAALARGYIMGLLSAPDEGKTYKALAGRTLRYAVIAARNFGFHPDDGGRGAPLGMIAYQGCAAYAFEQPVDDTALGGLPGAVILEHPVWLAEGKQYVQARDARARNETHYLTLLKPDLILVCNNKDFLNAVFLRMKAPSSTRALADSLPEWKYVDRTAPVWGLRHVARQRAGNDPSLGQMVIPDPKVIGLAIQVDSPPGEILVRWLSESQTNPWQAIADHPQFKGVQIRKAGDNVWEISATSNDPAAYMLIFAAMATMGFVVLV